MKPILSKGRLITATIFILILFAVYVTGARQGYHLGYADGQNSANGWWIDKKSQYYESAQIKKRRIIGKHNHI